MITDGEVANTDEIVAMARALAIDYGFSASGSVTGPAAILSKGSPELPAEMRPLFEGDSWSWEAPILDLGSDNTIPTLWAVNRIRAVQSGEAGDNGPPLLFPRPFGRLCYDPPGGR